MHFSARRITMKRLHGMVGFTTAGFIGLLLSGHSASAQLVLREQIVQALTTPPPSNFTDKPRLTRSLTIAHGDYVVAGAQSKPTVELHEIYFEFNSAALTGDAKPQLRELGAALRDPRLKGSTISIAGHTDAVGSDAFNQILSERRAATIKWYLIDNFKQNFMPLAMESSDRRTRRMCSPRKTGGLSSLTRPSRRRRDSKYPRQ